MLQIIISATQKRSDGSERVIAGFERDLPGISGVISCRFSPLLPGFSMFHAAVGSENRCNAEAGMRDDYGAATQRKWWRHWVYRTDQDQARSRLSRKPGRRSEALARDGIRRRETELAVPGTERNSVRKRLNEFFDHRP